MRASALRDSARPAPPRSEQTDREAEQRALGARASGSRGRARDSAVSAPPSTGPIAKKPATCAARQAAVVALVRKKCVTTVPIEWHTSVAGTPPARATAASTADCRPAK